jgi:predicted aldo/keto reductase-like oxidoreductase
MIDLRSDRRQFLRTTLAGGAALLVPSSGLSNSGGDEKEKKKPITRRLGNTGIELPVVSFGVMRADNPALVREAFKAGMVHFDTAHGYQRGKNEEMLGETLNEHPRNSFVVSTKVVPEDTDRNTGAIGAGSTAAAFLERLDTSLKRLKMEYVDILYVHAITTRDGALNEAMLDAVTKAKKAGKAKHVGVSTHRNEPEVIRAAIESRVYEVVLTSVNFRQGHYPDVKAAIGEAAKAGLGIVAMKTMAGGFYDKERTKPVNCSAALKFVLQDPNVSTSIPGITNFDHLAMNARINYDLTMTKEEEGEIAAGTSQGSLYCDGCNECVAGCRRQLPIPDLMRAYMYTYGYREPGMAHELIRELGVTSKPCGDCTSCLAQCRKQFDVRGRVADVARLADVPYELVA